MVCQAHVIQRVVKATQSRMASSGSLMLEAEIVLDELSGIEHDLKTAISNMTGPLQTRLVMITDRKCFS